MSKRYAESLRDSGELNPSLVSSLSTEQSVSVIGALMKRFREGVPAPPEQRDAPVKREEMWWIHGKNGRPVDAMIRESIESERSAGRGGAADYGNGASDVEGSPNPRVLPRTLGFGATAQQRHDGGNMPTMYDGVEPSPSQRNIGVDYMQQQLRNNPFYPSMSMSQLSASQGSSNFGGGGSIDDLDNYADALLDKCDAFIDQARAHQSGGGSGGSGQSPSSKAVNEVDVGASMDDQIRHAYGLHMQQVQVQLSGSRDFTSPAGKEPTGTEEYRVEELELEEGSPDGHLAGLQWHRVRHNTLASDGDAEDAGGAAVPNTAVTDTDAYDDVATASGTAATPQSAVTRSEMKNTSELIFPAKSPQSPPRIRVSPSPQGRVHHHHRDEVQSVERDSSIFPMYLSSSGDMTEKSAASRRSGNNLSAFSVVETDGNEVKVSLNASQILQIPEEEDQDNDKLGFMKETKRGLASPTTLLEQAADGEVRVSMSLEAVRLSQSRQVQQARVEFGDVEPFLGDKVLNHLWEALCEVRRHINAVNSV